ncbi:phosphatidylinositol kinase-related protein kinase tor1, partial [Exophiala xenobiotica]
MALQGQGHDPSERIFVELRSKNDEVKNKAASELRDLITLLSREWSPERFGAFYDRVTNRISNLIVQAPDPGDKVGGVLALDRLIDCEAIDAAQKASKYSNYLRAALKSNDYTVLDAASRALGHLARPGGAYTAELVEAEMTSAFEWLQPENKQESRKLAAVLLIREMARNSPTLVYGFIPQIFDLIWHALRDPKDLIRRTAAHSVSACFGVMVARDAQFQAHWFAKIYSKALEGFRATSTVDETLGSLLILMELLQQGNMFMHDFYRNACEIVLRLKDHRDPRIRTQVVQMIPVLAEYAPLEFINNYLHKFMIYLQAQLKREKERNQAFIAIGQIAKAVGSAIAQYLDGIILYIRESLIGQTLSKYMEALLDPIFACGLTEPMERALEDMAHHIPPIRTTIQDKLLDLLSLILVRSPYRPLGCPPNTVPPLPSFAKDYGGLPAEHKDHEITLALETVGKFDFSGHILNEFVRDVTLRYATNDNPEIRRAAALTCCQLFMQDPILHQTSNNAIQVVGEVVDKLLTVAVGDPDPDIRMTVLRALDKKFDKHLARPENIRCLFLAVNDEVFGVREAAIEIIGRLTTVNPAYVFPPLRKLLVNLLTGLGYSNTAKQKEESARLISLFVSNATSLVKTYVEAMVSALLPKATDPNPGVASTTIKALGDLTSVGGEEMAQHIPELMPIIIEALQDLGSHEKREAAMQTLSSLAVNSHGEEYMHMIIPAIVGIFENPAAPPNARRAAIDTLGKLSRTVNVTDFASLMIHPLAKILSSPERVVTNSSERSLKAAALDCVCALIYHLGQDFVHYLPLIERATKTGQINSERFQKLVENLKTGKPLPVDFYPEEQYGLTAEDTTYLNITSMRLPVNQQHLKNAWDTSQKSTKEDWQEWMRRFSVELLKESPSHALRACASLATVYQPLAKDLFNSAFVSCWTELYDQYQEELIRSIEKALTSTNIPPDILQTLLNLAEFMEHDDKSMPIDIRTLGRFAAKCHAFAKALHYKELEFEQDQNSQSVEALISINNQLQQSDAAIGILRRAQVFGEVELKEAWFEKLQRWEEALAAYQKREKIEPENFDIVMGKMRCLHALGEWKMLSEIAQEHWNSASVENRKNMSALAAAAAWGRGEWDSMDNYI